MYAEGGTLYLAVSKGGSKNWIQRVTIDCKRRDICLGGYPLISPVTAIQKALYIRGEIATGHDTRTERHRSAIPTFAMAKRRAHAMLKPR